MALITPFLKFSQTLHSFPEIQPQLNHFQVEETNQILYLGNRLHIRTAWEKKILEIFENWTLESKP